MKYLLTLMLLIPWPLFSKSKIVVPISIAAASIASCAVGVRAYRGEIAVPVACRHLDFISYSDKDSIRTVEEVRQYNRLFATLCFDYLSEEDQDLYRPIIKRN